MRRFVHSTRVVFVAAAGAFVAILFAAGNGWAQNPPGLGPTEHQLGYRINGPITGRGVLLSDQFNPVLDSYGIQGPTWLSVPTIKNQEPLLDPVTHYTWYELFSPINDPPRHMVYDNQFGEHELDVSTARFLLVPALKNPLPGQPLRTDVNHYKCYNAVGPALNVTIDLQNQFGGGTFQLGEPFLFCNPAVKVYEQTFPIAYAQDHLVCYQLLPTHPVSESVLVLDQFSSFGEPQNVFAFEGFWFCVPTLKIEVTPAMPQTWGGLKAIYR
jgi:hypothetical protein